MAIMIWKMSPISRDQVEIGSSTLAQLTWSACVDRTLYRRNHSPTQQFNLEFGSHPAAHSLIGCVHVLLVSQYEERGPRVIISVYLLKRN